MPSGVRAAAAPASGPDVQIDPADQPHLKAGLWQFLIGRDGGKPDATTLCLSGKATAMPHLPSCFTPLNLKRTFQGAYVMDATCATPDFTIVAHAVLTGDAGSKISSDEATTTTTPTGPTTRGTMHTDAHYVGPCALGQKPDDVGGPSGGG
ncbi:MAG TPA: hypothetical protein VN814_02245 [Caulobacteraceae bacterium]|nr:hypothetical protein [Caulobacteraceae bacterium]